MKKKILKLDVDNWLTDRRLRLCSPVARAFLIDIKCLCVPSGKLVMDGQPLSDAEIALLCGYSVEQVMELFKELAAAKMFAVDDDGLFFPDMVKDYAFKAQAKDAGARGAAQKKAKPASTPVEKQEVAATPANTKPAPKIPPPPLAKSVIAPKKPAAWWLTPSGWGRKGLEQAISMSPDEAFLDFQIRIAKRLPNGPHLDELPKHVAKMIRADIAEHAKKSEE
jgi:hypothetical protein